MVLVGWKEYSLHAAPRHNFPTSRLLALRPLSQGKRAILKVALEQYSFPIVLEKIQVYSRRSARLEKNPGELRYHPVQRHLDVPIRPLVGSDTKSCVLQDRPFLSST